MTAVADAVDDYAVAGSVHGGAGGADDEEDDGTRSYRSQIHIRRRAASRRIGCLEPADDSTQSNCVSSDHNHGGWEEEDGSDHSVHCDRSDDRHNVQSDARCHDDDVPVGTGTW